jgi:hypothetical protein
MRGRVCLLALSFLILSPGILRGQSDRNDRASWPAPDPIPKVAVSPPYTVQPPSLRLPGPDPIHPWPYRPAAPPGTFGLRELAKASGMIFSATVTGVARRHTTGGDSLGAIAITFHVENSIHGAIPGEDLTVVQWIGLWSGGQRYRVGDRALFFLYPPSKLGLTSCVGWPLGRFSLDSSGHVLLSAQQFSAFRRDPVLGGKSRVSFRDFARAVRQASGEE